jgi:dihydrofolate synthase/folylpolyglutamate synthase
LSQQPTTDSRQPKRTLDEWLDYQQRIHPRSIELGLDRVRAVWLRMGAPRPAPVVITVGGTNGKGSTVAFLEAMLAAGGKRVGCYTSPHLLRYNERVRVLGDDASDRALIDAFERIEAARSDVALTYFEFGTLAALWIFSQSVLDVAVLEVGLGGRLDAVNIIDADVAIVTTVDLDHQDWLGNDRDSIGREKAGIFRAAQAAVIGMREANAGLLAEGQRIGARMLRAGSDYRVIAHGAGWRWQMQEACIDVPAPALAAPCQIDNASAAIAALYTLRERLGWNADALAAGVVDARAAARLQQLHKPGAATLVVDVAHNPQAAAVLGAWLRGNDGGGRTLAVFGALADKDVAGIVAPLAPHIVHWHLGGLEADTPRGLSASALQPRVLAAAPSAGVTAHVNVVDALTSAATQAGPHDRILAFGSFFVAAAALQWAQRNGWTDQRLERS